MTAKEARTIALSKSLEGLSEIREFIKTCAEIGYTRCTYSKNVIRDEVISTLIDDGYDIRNLSRGKDVMYEIRWD